MNYLTETKQQLKENPTELLPLLEWLDEQEPGSGTLLKLIFIDSIAPVAAGRQLQLNKVEMKYRYRAAMDRLSICLYGIEALRVI